MAGNDPGADNIGMGFYLIDHIAGNGGFNINDIIADEAVALIDIARYVYVVGTDNVGGKADHPGNIPIYHNETGMAAPGRNRLNGREVHRAADRAILQIILQL